MPAHERWSGQVAKHTLWQAHSSLRLRGFKMTIVPIAVKSGVMESKPLATFKHTSFLCFKRLGSTMLTGNDSLTAFLRKIGMRLPTCACSLSTMRFADMPTTPAYHMIRYWSISERWPALSLPCNRCASARSVEEAHLSCFARLTGCPAKSSQTMLPA